MGLPPYQLIGTTFKSAASTDDAVKRAEENVRQALCQEQGPDFAASVVLTPLEIDTQDRVYTFVSFLVEEKCKSEHSKSGATPGSP